MLLCFVLAVACGVPLEIRLTTSLLSTRLKDLHVNCREANFREVKKYAASWLVIVMLLYVIRQ